MLSLLCLEISDTSSIYIYEQGKNSEVQETYNTDNFNIVVKREVTK
jgi:hypothetical protein